MVDYSKWNSLDSDASGDEADSKPRVHRFEGSQQVTFGGPGGQVQVAPSAPQAEANDAASDDEPMEPPDEELDSTRPDEDRREDILNCRGLAERALRAGEASEAVRLLEKAMRLGGAQLPGTEEVLASARRKAAEQALAGKAAGDIAMATGSSRPSAAPLQASGGTVEGRYSWSQARNTVDVNAFVPEGTKAKTIQVEVSEARVCIKVAGAKVLEGEWEFKVEPEEDPDWEVRDFEGRRVVRLTVRKATVPGGLSVVVWWQRVLKGDPGIDVRGIEGRKKEKTESFAKAWGEAHVQFKEKAKSRKRISIDAEGNMDED